MRMTGLAPITIAGGAVKVKVKDDVTIDFDIVTRLNSRTER
jgi:hypothetical protein